MRINARRLPTVLALCVTLLATLGATSPVAHARGHNQTLSYRSTSDLQTGVVAPELIGTVGGPVAPTTSVLVDGLTAYVGEEKSLVIFDVINPKEPKEWERISLPASANDIEIANGFLYLALQNGDVQIVDVGQTDSPTLHSTYRPAAQTNETARNATSVQVSGDQAFITYSIQRGDIYAGEFQIIDVHNPSRPVLRSSVSYRANMARHVQVSNNTAYVALSGIDSGGLAIYDVSDPAHPISIGTFTTPPAQYINVVNERAYITVYSEGMGESGLHVLDVRDPAHVMLLGHFASDAASVQVIGSLAYLSGQSGLQIVDVSAPAMMTERGRLRTSGGATSISVIKSRAYVSTQGGLHIIDVSIPEQPRLHNTNITRRVLDVQIADHIAYLYDEAGDPALQIVDIRDPAHPVLRGRLTVSFEINDIAVEGTTVYLAAGLDGVQIVDTKNLDAPALHGRYDTPGYAHAVHVHNHIAYVADGTHGLQIVDVLNPTQPLPLGAVNTRGVSTTLDVMGSLVYVGDIPSADDPASESGVHIVDVGNPTKPVLRGSYAPLAAHHLQVVNDKVFVAAGTNGLAILEANDPSAPVLRGGHYGLMARHVAIAGSLAFVADGVKGVQILDVSHPTTTRRLGTLASSDYVPAVQAVDDLVMVADDGGGLRIWRVYTDRLQPTIYLPIIKQ